MSIEGNTQQREAVETNWDALTNAYSGTTITQEQKKEEPIVPAVTPEKLDEPVTAPVIEGTEPAAPEAKTPEEEAVALKAEATELGLPETATKEEVEAARIEKEADKPIIEFKVEDIKGNEATPAEDSWFAPAKALGLEIKEDSLEALRDAIAAPYIKQAEDSKSIGMETLFSTLKPETVAAFKLLEMGIPQEQLFHPTQEIENYLKMDDAALVRADKEAMGWPIDRIDKELEYLTEKNLIEHEAFKLKEMLNSSKENIIKERETFIQQYETKRQEAILSQKEEEKTHFTKAMNTVSTFMGAPIPADVKEAIIKKYNNGLYDNELNTPTSKVEYILQKELGQKVLKALENTAFQKGKDTTRTKLLVIPPVTGNNAGQNQPIKQEQDNWSAAEKAFGNK